MTSSGGEPKIYLRGVTPHKLIHGGLGHRPLLYEELVLLDFICKSFGVFGPFRWFYGKHTQLGISLFDSCKLECEVTMSVWQSYPKPIFPKNTPSYAHKSYFETEEKGFSRPEFLMKS